MTNTTITDNAALIRLVERQSVELKKQRDTIELLRVRIAQVEAERDHLFARLQKLEAERER
jgi:hypothetical protein